ncbi:MULTISPECIES: DUF5994 family protein [Amycolatopsis]|uniref:Uncharacterized protein n=2 Tax=Amycolatopsis TaxID=1813 RepID=A0A1I4AH17_9PSEU|nr:DUF5994 family protein [Amycolatopsis sacchari]SFK55563.1 hypothetical protein SAMN05421835_12410 [Amycolatopsis sacchari]
MISAQNRSHAAPVDQIGVVVRLQMKPAGAARGFVDGGWWPHSNDPAAEFPALVVALGASVGPVSRMSYHLDTWDAVARKMPVQGRVVRFGGFRSMDTHTVEVIGSDGRRVSLLVVPPGTPGGTARAVLRSAAASDSTASVADILASNGVTPSTGDSSPLGTTSRTAEPAPEQRWETEGGHLHAPA